MDKSGKKLILGLETGIDGGSVAVLDEDRLLCSASGAGDISKSEDLLVLIDELLKKHALPKNDIGYIAVSDSPGSLTGIRIGLATAAGLKDSISAEIIKLPILEAQVIISPAKNRVISALYSEKNGFYFCTFRFNNGVLSAETETSKVSEPDRFVELLAIEDIELVLDKSIAENFADIPQMEFLLKKKETYFVNGNPARKIGLAAQIKMRPIKMRPIMN